MENRKVIIQDSDGVKTEVELVTYLINDSNKKTYLVYSKGEKTGAEDDEIIYVSRIVREDNIIYIDEITDDNEWIEVQNLLKKIANKLNIKESEIKNYTIIKESLDARDKNNLFYIYEVDVELVVSFNII